MRKYKIELHCHTKETSPCGVIPATEVIDLYVKDAYDGLVITDHFAPGVFDKNKDILDQFYKGYESAYVYGKDKIKIYLGVELRLKEAFNDYLVYGDVRKLLAYGERLFDMTIKEVYVLVRQLGLAMFSAHPFRPNMKELNPSSIDGIEVYNMHPGQKSRNYLAHEYAKEHNLIGISGSDCHDYHHLGRGGILTDVLPENEDALKDLLLKEDFDLYF